MDLSLLNSIIKGCCLNLSSLILKKSTERLFAIVTMSFCCWFWYTWYYGWYNSQRRVPFICFVWQQPTTNLVPCYSMYLAQLLVLELISQFHCQLETYSLVRRNSWSQIFSASTLTRCPDSCTWSAELQFIPHEIIDIFTGFLTFIFANDLLIITGLLVCFHFWKWNLNKEFTND